MKIVIAPDKFKGSLSAFEFCDAVESGLSKLNKPLEIVKLPLADGGDGTVDVVNYYLNAEKIQTEVKDPLFRTITSSYLFSNATKSAFIEMAEASGLHLLKEEERNCMNTTSFGTGEMIKDAIQRGAKKIILGIGGSATNDCGIGMANALGFRFLDTDEREVVPVGKNLGTINRIDASGLNKRLHHVDFKVACDVGNPLYGREGAAHVYAAQKGANPDEIRFLDEGLKHFSSLLSNHFKTDPQNIKGGGAAGGMGVATKLFLDAELVSGIDLIMELARFAERINGADWIITGEGKLDSQTASGKTISGVLKLAREHEIPVAALCGSVALSKSEQEAMGLKYVSSILENTGDMESAIRNAYVNLVFMAQNLGDILSK
ncbi:glycerate kinase [Leptobacterium flavescens]|uniref:Glycerate kinase n=1 Tax=Leptobacterium flavescens TaxID=472055 RepID=A0A6P0UJX8_9FLAO|nr:glycerate kinase [Leptobacterium flavescens]NER13277.1 glycerate kinase [Leptobacterium flavescens]